MKLKNIGAVVGGSLLAVSLTAQAADALKNTGTLAGWNHIQKENKGSVSEVTNVTYEGGTALKMTQTYDASYTGRYHAEVHKYDVYRRGDTGFYGFAFRLQADWQTQPQSYNIAQFIADFSDKKCDGYMPTTMVWISGNQLFARVKHGPVCSPTTVVFGNLATVVPGQWHKVILQAKWASDDSGFFKLWFDGKKVLEKYNQKTTVEDDRFLQFRVGLYANGWHDSGSMQGSQATRSIWFDEIGTGTTFADADPAQW